MEIILPPEPQIQRLMNYVFENYRELDDFCEIERESKDTAKCVKCHHDSYFPGGNPIYECDNFKRVYLIRFLARQFEQSEFLIQEHVIGEIEGKTDLSAISLGGGPAPEALALMNQLSSCKGDYKLSFDNIDCEASWEDTYHDICNQFVNYIGNVKLKTSFTCYDVTRYVSRKRYDVVFISWIFSDMRGQNGSNVLQVASNLAKPQGYILLMDYHESALVAEISALVDETQGLTLAEHESKKYVHSIVDFPPDIKDTFGPDMGVDFAYWVLQSSPDIPF